MRPLRKAVFDIIHHFPPFINITFHFFQKGALQPLNLCYNVRVPIRKGPVAQLGARSVRIREVVGSNPIRSTIRSTVILIELRWIFLLLRRQLSAKMKYAYARIIRAPVHRRKRLEQIALEGKKANVLSRIIC